MIQKQSWEITDKFWEKVLNSIVTERPEPTAKNHKNLCADNGYTGEPALEIIVLRGYIPHVVSRRQEKKNMEKKEIGKIFLFIK
jgi:hypothetical protein